MALCARCGSPKLSEHPCPQCGANRNAPDRTFVRRIGGKAFTIDCFHTPSGPLYGCGILPLRASLETLLADIQRAQGPEWRLQKPP